MPLGNLTSQFFANVYLNELDHFVKQKLQAKYYIRYVDDFLILHSSKNQLQQWKDEIDKFLEEKLDIRLHPDKSRIISLGRHIPFLGFRIGYYHKLLKKCNRRHALQRVEDLYREEKIDYDKVCEAIQGTFAYMRHANTYRLRMKIAKQMKNRFPKEISTNEINRYLKNQRLMALLSRYGKKV